MFRQERQFLQGNGRTASWARKGRAIVKSVQKTKPPQKATSEAHFEAEDCAALDLANTRFEDCEFDHLDLQKRDLGGAKFVDCVFDTCDMVVAKVTDCSFTRVTFRNCRLSGINWSLAQKLESVSFEECQLNDGAFIQVRLEGCDFKRCSAQGVSFREVSLVKASFQDSGLSMAEFVRCDLRGADFRGATGYVINAAENHLQNSHFSLPEAVTLLTSLGIILD